MTAYEAPGQPTRRSPRARLSVSIPADLAAWTREKARRDGTSISAIVTKALDVYFDRVVLR